MPTNLYGSNDNFNLQTSHVLPAMMRKIHLAKCLEQNNFTAVRKDLTLMPYSLKEKYTNDMTEDDIVKLLNSFGINIINSKLKTNNLSFNEVALTLWGSGAPYREFLHVDDLTDALLYLMNNYSDYGHINVGTGKDLQIKELAEMTKTIVGFQGKINWDNSKPDGTPRKLLDVSKLTKQGWSHKVDLKSGISEIYKNYNSENYL